MSFEVCEIFRFLSAYSLSGWISKFGVVSQYMVDLDEVYDARFVWFKKLWYSIHKSSIESGWISKFEELKTMLDL